MNDLLLALAKETLTDCKPEIKVILEKLAVNAAFKGIDIVVAGTETKIDDLIVGTLKGSAQEALRKFIAGL